jgi:hypothetical protein
MGFGASFEGGATRGRETALGSRTAEGGEAHATEASSATDAAREKERIRIGRRA